MRGIAIACLAAVILSGCGPEASGPPEFQIGTGSDAFAAVAAGESLPIIEGWQGGFHVWVAGRSRGLEEPLVADFGVRDRTSGESLTYLDLEQKVHPDHGGDWDEFSGLVARFRHDDPTLYTGRRVVVWAHVTDDAGETQSDEVEATLR